jgi:hypothetical protein
MNYATGIQFHKIEFTCSRIRLLTILLAFLCTVNACRKSGEPSEEQIERAKKTVSEIRASLYTPADAELLEELLNYGSNPEFYPGCVSGDVYLAYRSPKSFDEILQEYRTGIDEGGWQPSPGYPHDDKNHDVFQLGTQAILLIASYPIREDILVVPTPSDPNEQQDTIYYIALLYYEPSISECSEL